MKITFLTWSLLILLAFTSCSKSDDEKQTQPDPPAQDDITAIDNSVNNFLTKYNIPGASLAVSKNGKLVYAKGYGVADQGTGDKVTTASRFRVASVSKTYTGAAVNKLAQDGKLSLDDKVFGENAILGTEYGTPPYNENLSNMTVRHLLTHTSGSWGSATGTDVIDYNPSYSTKEFMDWVLNTRPNPKVPGTFYDYSNVGYWIAGRIIEKVSGKSYLNYLKEDLLAGTGSTQTDLAGQKEIDRKTNEVKYYGQGSDASYVYNIAFPRRDSDGGLITTSTDLLRFITAVDGFPTRPDVLNSAAINEFTTASDANPGYACGIGIWDAEHVWFNYGSLPGTRSGFMRHDNGKCVALILNSRADPSSNDLPFVYAMQDLMLDMVKNSAYKWQDIDQF
jgi:CubicO group peptidase (beta-lactamase class C family)